MATLYLPLLRGFMTIEGASQDNVAAVFINLNSLGPTSVWGSISTQKTYNMKIPVVTYNSYQAPNTNEVDTGIRTLFVPQPGY